jgi:thiamine monophosphate kinase
MKKTSTLPGEFELIARYFAPLAKGFPGAFGLLDAAAVIASLPGHELVAKTDAIVEGVHFRPDDPPDLVARKALRVNLAGLDELTELSQTLDVPITAIGRVESPPIGRKARIGVLDGSGKTLGFDRSGWTHFSSVS